ncbi:riboflavin synthase [Flavobacteriaceae bacterium TK19130]|nr:riboflavin synthase [Thermobacterium salinum]
MFTGIIEAVGRIVKREEEGSNVHFTISSEMAGELKVDQSVSHNGVCLTVTSQQDASYTVTAIKETLEKSNLGKLKTNDRINLERAMQYGARLDGHLVQGHVDQVATCKQIREEDGSWVYTFTYKGSKQNITVEKGSITVNGVSLTVVGSKDGEFSVAIIPYTYEHTNFKYLSVGDTVNLEFDVIGKYVQRLMSGYL